MFLSQVTSKVLGQSIMDPGPVTLHVCVGRGKRQGHGIQHNHLVVRAEWDSSPQKELWGRTSIVEWSNKISLGYPTKRETIWEKTKRASNTWVRKPFGHFSSISWRKGEESEWQIEPDLWPQSNHHSQMQPSVALTCWRRDCGSRTISIGPYNRGRKWTGYSSKWALKSCNGKSVTFKSIGNGQTEIWILVLLCISFMKVKLFNLSKSYVLCL